MKQRDIIYILCIVLLLMILLLHSRPNEIVKAKRQVDTVYFRDTIREPVPVPYAVYTTDTVVLTVYVPVEIDGLPDSLPVSVPLPIEDVDYITPNYHATVRGYRPELVRLDLFPESMAIYEREQMTISKRRRWGVGIQVGYGIAGGQVKPYVGAGIQYNIFTF